MKRLWIFAIASAVLLTGCASQQSKTESGAAAGGAADVNSSPAITEIAVEDITIAETETQPPVKLTSPPEIRISLITEMTASAGFLTKSAYSWNYEDNGEMASVITDCGVPSELKDVNVEFDPDELTRAAKVHVPVGAKIVKIECWNGTTTQSVGFNDDGEIELPVEPIGNTYCVTMEFPEGWGSYGEFGTCDYVFRTTDNVSNEPDTDSGNSTESVPPATAQSSAGFNPEEPVQLPGHIVSDPMEKTPEPPELSLGVYFKSSDEQLEVILSQNAFTWSFVDSHGNATDICVDCPAPFQLDLEPSFDIADVDHSRVELTDDGKLTGVTNWSTDGEALAVKFDETGEIYFPENPIGDIYSLQIEFPEGCCTYVFAAERPELELYDSLQNVLSSNAPEYDLDNLYKPEGSISRVNWDERIAPTAMIRSLDELKTYYTAHLANEWTAFEDCFPKYDGTFFEKNVLVISYFDEGSGSIKHEYLGIDNENGCIVVRRTTPEVGTDDMAAYVLTVEIPADKALESYELVFDNIYEWDFVWDY